jgi:hypothetical protein
MLESKFILATINEIKDSSAWVLKITYSYYGLYTFTDVFVYSSQDACVRKLCMERCHGVVDIKNKENVSVFIDPDL